MRPLVGCTNSRMSRMILLVTALTLASALPAHAQRRFRGGPAISSISPGDLSGASHRFTGYGGAVALITRDDGGSGPSVPPPAEAGADGRGAPAPACAL